MSNTNYYDFMTVKDLKDILSKLPDEMLVVIPVVDEDDANKIYAFRKVRTAGILECDSEECSKVICLNCAADGQDIADQVWFSKLDVSVLDILYGETKYDREGSTQNG